MQHVRTDLTDPSDMPNVTAATAAECAFLKHNRNLMDSVLKKYTVLLS